MTKVSSLLENDDFDDVVTIIEIERYKVEWLRHYENLFTLVFISTFYPTCGSPYSVLTQCMKQGSAKLPMTMFHFSDRYMDIWKLWRVKT